MFNEVFGLSDYRLKSLRDGLRGVIDSRSSAEHICENIVDAETVNDINMKGLSVVRYVESNNSP